MSHFLIIVGAVIAVIAVGAPLAAILLVSVASRREESAHTLSGQAPGAVTRAARRLLAYRSETEVRPTWVQRQDRLSHPRSSAPLTSAVRPIRGQARRAVEPVTIRLGPDARQDWREPARTHAA
ncbi:MAG: hypothetical protein ACR2FU_09430 [Streptosporangiaceae bacterium]